MSERPDYPTNADILAATLELHDLDVWTAFPGRIQNYDPERQTADIVPLLRTQIPMPDGSYTYEDPPMVPSVAIIQPRTRGWFFSLPVQDGDTVLCVVCDGDVGTWRRGSGDLTTPRDLRRHHMAHAVAFVGLYTWGQPLAYKPPRVDPEHIEPTDAAMLFGSDAADGTRVAINHDGAVVITRGSDVAFRIDADGTVHAGGAGGEFATRADRADSQLAALRAAVNTLASAIGAPPPFTVVPPSVAMTKAKGV